MIVLCKVHCMVSHSDYRGRSFSRKACVILLLLLLFSRLAGFLLIVVLPFTKYGRTAINGYSVI